MSEYDSSTTARQGWLTTLNWAAYLACSWTWCIGMFLPVLLVRDFGVWGFVVFAVPNVLGAAAMGWVLRSRAAAGKIASEHRTMCLAFSLVTIAFQVFFLLSISYPSPVRGFAAAPSWAVPLLIIGTGALLLPWRGRLFGLTAWVVSVTLLAGVALNGGLNLPHSGAMTPWGSEATSAADVLWLAPVCAFGFVLCPYLDLTFCRARASLQRSRARGAFTLGFGALFLVMILGTLGYAATALMGMVDRDLVPGQVRLLLGLHIAFQLVFTVVVHAVEVLSPDRRGAMRRLFWPWIGLIVASVPGTALSLEHAGLSLWEITYRLFMAFYGLVFPAYAWLCMIPVRGEHIAAPSAGKARVFVGAVALASPFYWMGFIERETWWLGPGLFIVLAARVFVPRAPAPSSV